MATYRQGMAYNTLGNLSTANMNTAITVHRAWLVRREPPKPTRACTGPKCTTQVGWRRLAG
eukprot:7860234-Alexandrium_andersonii.AAC.1